MTQFRLVGAAVAAVALASAANANSFDEKGNFNGAGGTGNSIPPFGLSVSGDFNKANVTAGGLNPLTQINGQFFNGADNDPYVIEIFDPDAFSATIVVDGTQTYNLSLFDANTFEAVTGSINGSLSSVNVTAPGEYILLVGTTIALPGNAAGEEIFDFSVDGVEVTPSAPSSDNVFFNYVQPVFGFPSFVATDYTVTLTGTNFAPTPGAAGALAIAGLLATRRRR